MRNLKFRLAAAVALLPLSIAVTARAQSQSIDYGSLEQLFGEPVTTSATGSPQRSTDVPVDMTIISADEIKRSGAHDVQTLLSRVPGVDVLSWSSQSADVGVRGYDQPLSPRLLVLINGRQVYLDHYGYMSWSSLPVELAEIRQIEVVKGPNAALFGFNAVSGVVNIITYNPKYDKVNEGAVSVFSRGGSQASLLQTIRLSPKFSMRLSAGASKSDEWDNTAGLNGIQYFPRAFRNHVSLDGVYSLGERTELRFGATTSNSRTTETLPVYESVPSKYVTSSFKLDLTSDTHLGLLSATAYRNTLSNKMFTISMPGDYDNTITDISVQDLFKVGARHTFRLGLESRTNEMGTAPFQGGKLSYDVQSASVMWNWATSDAFNLSLAARSDELTLKREGSFAPGFPLADNSLWDRKISQVSYNAGAVWRASEHDAVRLMAARGAQLPSLIELGGLQLAVPLPGFTIAMMGNPALKPAVIDNVELSYDHTFAAARMGVRIFSQTSKDIKGQISPVELFQYPTMTTYPAVSWDNVADSKMTGFELSGSGKIAGGMRWSGDYTATDVKDTPLGTHNIVARKAAYGLTTPKSRANFNLGWSGTKWSIDGFVHYSSSYVAFALSTSQLTRIPAYSTVAANLSYGFDNGTELSVSGQNLMEGHQMQTTGLRVPRTVYLTVKKGW